MSYYREGPFRPGGAQIRFGVPTVTPMVKGIIIACAVVWLIQMMTRSVFLVDLPGPRRPGPFWEAFSMIPGLFFRGFFWQPATSMFLHDPSSLFHILFNMLMLWMFGTELERHWGSRAFLRCYLVCGIGAGLLAALLAVFQGGPAMYGSTIGASGAIFGLLVAYGMIFAERTVLFMMIFPMKARTFALVFSGIALFNVLGQSGGGVSHISHLGGALTGFLYLKRVWRVGEFYRELRWRMMRRKFKVMRPDDDDDRWIH